MSIFWNTDSYLSVIEKPLGIIKVGTKDCGNGVYLLRAGTPLNASGAVANTANAKYLVAEDFYFYSNTPNQAKVVPLIEAGYVDLKKAEAAFGKSYTDAAKSALETAGIILVDGAISSGGGGSGVLIAHATVDASTFISASPAGVVTVQSFDKTGAEIAAVDSSVVEVALIAGSSTVVTLIADKVGSLDAMGYYAYHCDGLAIGQDLNYSGFTLLVGDNPETGTTEAMLFIDAASGGDAPVLPVYFIKEQGTSYYTPVTDPTTTYVISTDEMNKIAAAINAGKLVLSTTIAGLLLCPDGTDHIVLQSGTIQFETGAKFSGVNIKSGYLHYVEFTYTGTDWYWTRTVKDYELTEWTPS